jgi:hypothetical protein
MKVRGREALTRQLLEEWVPKSDGFLCPWRAVIQIEEHGAAC